MITTRSTYFLIQEVLAAFYLPYISVLETLVCLYMVDIKIAHGRRDMCCNISNTGCTDTTKLPNTIDKYTAGAPT